MQTDPHPPATPVGCYDRALALCGDAAGLGLFEIAYHALVAALHAAEVLEDTGRLAAVERLAGELGAKVDAQEPPHRLSTREADRRGHRGVFPLAARQARARAWLVRRAHPESGPAGPPPT